MEEAIRATVTAIENGRRGPYAVAVSSQIDNGSVTFSLHRSVWHGRGKPKVGDEVYLTALRLSANVGWRSEHARFWRPSDGQSSNPATEQ